MPAGLRQSSKHGTGGNIQTAVAGADPCSGMAPHSLLPTIMLTFVRQSRGEQRCGLELPEQLRAACFAAIAGGVGGCGQLNPCCSPAGFHFSRQAHTSMNLGPELPAEVVERIFRVERPGGEPGEPLLRDKERVSAV